MELILLFGSYICVAGATLFVWQSTINRFGPKFKWTHFPQTKPRRNELWRTRISAEDKRYARPNNGDTLRIINKIKTDEGAR